MAASNRPGQAAAAIEALGASPSPADARRELAEFDAKDVAAALVSRGGGGGSQPILKSDPVTLIDAEIKALPTTPIELLPAPGSDKALYHVFSLWQLDTRGGGYTFDNPFGDDDNYKRVAIGLANWLQAIYREDIEGAFGDIGQNLIFASTYQYVGALAVSYSKANWQGTRAQIDNVALVIGSSPGFPESVEINGGHPDNTLTVTVYYVVLDLV